MAPRASATRVVESERPQYFGFVNTYDKKSKRRLYSLLQEQGLQNNQQITFLSDGGDSIRGLQTFLSPEAEHILDWFHVTMRLTVMTQIAKGINELTPNLPLIRVDVSQIRQVIMNLITNAAEACGNQCGVVTLRTSVFDRQNMQPSNAELFEEISAEGDCVLLEVSDTGCGMDQQTIAKIFEPFYTTKFTGRGLGLAAVQGIIRGHQGAIKVHSQPERGTTFRILFPCTQSAPVVVARKPKGLKTWQGCGTILLVDDEPGARDIAAKMLERMGFTVVARADGQEALEVVRQQGEELDAVLLDLSMPRMDGIETLVEIRSTCKDLPVVLSSGYSEPEATQDLVGKGLAAFVQKPYQYQTLMATLQTVLT